MPLIRLKASTGRKAHSCAATLLAVMPLFLLAGDSAPAQAQTAPSPLPSTRSIDWTQGRYSRRDSGCQLVDLQNDCATERRCG